MITEFKPLKLCTQ